MKHYEEVQNNLKSQLVEAGLRKHADYIIKFTRPSIKITTEPIDRIISQMLEQNNSEEEILFSKKPVAYIKNKILKLSKPENLIPRKRNKKDTFDSGLSKFGGIPDLSDDIEWPYFKNKPLAFLAQLNLEDLAEYDINKLLPPTGMLYFFYEIEEFRWGFDIEDKYSWKVIYIPNVSKIKRREKTPVIKELFVPCKLSFSLDCSLPILDLQPFGNSNFTYEEEEIYLNLSAEPYGKDVPIHKVFGYANAIQDEEMELECELVTNNINIGSPEGYSNPKVEELKESAKDWLLLLQIDSDNNAEFMWGDWGRIYFWIKKQDLKNLNFNNVWMTLQCY